MQTWGWSSHLTEHCEPQGHQVTCARLTGGTLCTPGPGWQLCWDSHLCPASQARVPFLSVCFVFHWFAEEKNCSTTQSIPPTSQLFTVCTGGHKKGGEACM